MSPLITNDAIVLGLLLCILGLVFHTASLTTPFWRRFYTVVPSLLLCYFVPSLLTTLGIISADGSQLYFVASRYLLPTSLVLLTVSIDLGAVLRLGPKALILFLTGTAGVVLGGPIAIWVVSWFDPALIAGDGPDATWRGLTTIAGSWIGGGANQAAMKEVFNVGDDIFSALVAVDVLVASLWMAVLLYAAGRSEALDARMGADTQAITTLRDQMAEYQAQIARIPALPDLMRLLAVGFGVTALAHLGADWLAPTLQALAADNPEHPLVQTSLTSGFFWLIVLATTGGVALSFTSARNLEGVGASRIGSAMLYLLVATIGMKMNLLAVFEQPSLFAIGGVWIAIHAGLLLITARLIRAPLFFLAVGSQANIGGAASAPIVASAFHPALAPVGVLLAVVGYALGTYAAWVCGQLMRLTVTSLGVS